jgi:hypothetical protein
MNEEVMLEKIACDAYRLFSDGLFATPKVRLSHQAVEDEYTKDGERVKAYLNQSICVLFRKC